MKKNIKPLIKLLGQYYSILKRYRLPLYRNNLMLFIIPIYIYLFCLIIKRKIPQKMLLCSMRILLNYRKISKK